MLHGLNDTGHLQVIIVENDKAAAALNSSFNVLLQRADTGCTEHVRWNPNLSAGVSSVDGEQVTFNVVKYLIKLGFQRTASKDNRIFSGTVKVEFVRLQYTALVNIDLSFARQFRGIDNRQMILPSSFTFSRISRDDNRVFAGAADIDCIVPQTGSITF